MTVAAKGSSLLARAVIGLFALVVVALAVKGTVETSKALGSTGPPGESVSTRPAQE